MENGIDRDLVQRFFEILIPKQLHSDPAETAREFRYFSALSDAMGEGKGGFYQFIYQYQHDIPALVDAYLQKPGLSPEIVIQAAQQWFANQNFDDFKRADAEGPLSQADLAHWDEHGYVIVKNIIDRTSSLEVANWVMDYIGLDLNDASTWYKRVRSNIMEEVYNHPFLDRARKSTKALRAFQQLWKTNNLTHTRDRVSVNLPENLGHVFDGPKLHLDVAFAHPWYFSTQGIVYLNDVAEDQGAFTLCPGFHHQYRDWISGLPAGVNPNDTDFYRFPHKSIAAGAGDLIIWHQWLPHGASANKHKQPRIAQYLNMYSLEPCFV